MQSLPTRSTSAIFRRTRAVLNVWNVSEYLGDDEILWPGTHRRAHARLVVRDHPATAPEEQHCVVVDETAQVRRGTNPSQVTVPRLCEPCLLKEIVRVQHERDLWVRAQQRTETGQRLFADVLGRGACVLPLVPICPRSQSWARIS